MFVASCGGLLGLGFGFSVLSAAELFYFFLIRWCYHYYQSKKLQPAPVQVSPHQPFLKARNAKVFAHRLQKMHKVINNDFSNGQLYDIFPVSWTEFAGGFNSRSTTSLQYVKTQQLQFKHAISSPSVSGSILGAQLKPASQRFFTKYL